MTEVTRWRGKGAIVPHHHLPLPEPPRYRRVSRWAREPKDRITRALEEWLSDLAVASTIDAD